MPALSCRALCALSHTPHSFACATGRAAAAGALSGCVSSESRCRPLSFVLIIMLFCAHELSLSRRSTVCAALVMMLLRLSLCRAGHHHWFAPELALPLVAAVHVDCCCSSGSPCCASDASAAARWLWFSRFFSPSFSVACRSERKALSGGAAWVGVAQPPVPPGGGSLVSLSAFGLRFCPGIKSMCA